MAANSVVIYVFRNNDVFTPAIRVPIMPKHNTFAKFKQHLTDVIKLVGTTVRKVYTVAGKPVKEMDDFENKGYYIACGDETLKKCNYPVPDTTLLEPAAVSASQSTLEAVPTPAAPVEVINKSILKKTSSLVLSQSMHSTSKLSRSVASQSGKKDPTIFILRNGDAFHKAEKVVINQKRFRDVGALYQKLDALTPLAMGQVRKICTLQGKPIRAIAELEDGEVYVACGTEVFAKSTRYQVPAKITAPVEAEPADATVDDEVAAVTATVAELGIEEQVALVAAAADEVVAVPPAPSVPTPVIDRRPAPPEVVAEVTAAAVYAEAAVAAAEVEETAGETDLGEAKLKYLAAEVALLRKTVDEKDRKIEELEAAHTEDITAENGAPRSAKKSPVAPQSARRGPVRATRARAQKDDAIATENQENNKNSTNNYHKYPTRSHVKTTVIEVVPAPVSKQRAKRTRSFIPSPHQQMISPRPMSIHSPPPHVLRSPMAPIFMP